MKKKKKKNFIFLSLSLHGDSFTKQQYRGRHSSPLECVYIRSLLVVGRADPGGSSPELRLLVSDILSPDLKIKLDC